MLDVLMPEVVLAGARVSSLSLVGKKDRRLRLI